MSKNRIILTVIIVFVIVAPTTAYFVLQQQQGNPTTAQTTTQSTWLGRVAPVFTSTAVNGSTFSLASYKGRSNVLLLFNEGLSCSPCLQQMQEMDVDYAATYKSMNVVIVGITADTPSDLGTWARVNKITNMIVISDNNLAVDKEYSTLGDSMHPGSTPGHTFILVDTSGIVRWRDDYGPGVMYVPNNQIVSSIKSALAGT